jgi:signal transduction histidine kinase
MRLAAFIHDDMEGILEEWEAFAATLLPGAAGMTALALRDHAEQILHAVATDIATPQTRQAHSEKSKGRLSPAPGAPETAAQTHAVLRAQSGFDINQLVAEYRALRASVLHRWMATHSLDHHGVSDVIRFNEAIDQAIAESIGHFHTQVERSRALLLGMLGHDMRSPLNTILATASYLAALNAGEDVSVAAGRLIRSGASIQALLNDLVDFNRTRLGLGLNVVPADIDLRAVVADELEQLRGGHPRQRIELVITGDTCGCWDSGRLQQLLRNLLMNAIQYGAPDTPIGVTVRGDTDDVRLEVTNSGPPIDPATLGEIFDPLVRGPERAGRDTQGGLGLGLFIVREIAKAHGAEVVVRAIADKTTFAVRLPRRHDRPAQSA